MFLKWSPPKENSFLGSSGIIWQRLLNSLGIVAFKITQTNGTGHDPCSVVFSTEFHLVTRVSLWWAFFLLSQMRSSNSTLTNIRLECHIRRRHRLKLKQEIAANIFGVVKPFSEYWTWIFDIICRPVVPLQENEIRCLINQQTCLSRKHEAPGEDSYSWEVEVEKKLVDGDFELVPTCSYHSHGVGESAIRMFDSFLVQTPEWKIQKSKLLQNFLEISG